MVFGLLYFILNSLLAALATPQAGDMTYAVDLACSPVDEMVIMKLSWNNRLEAA